MDNLLSGFKQISILITNTKHKQPCSVELFITNLIQSKALFKDSIKPHTHNKLLTLYSLFNRVTLKIK